MPVLIFGQAFVPQGTASAQVGGGVGHHGAGGEGGCDEKTEHATQKARVSRNCRHWIVPLDF